MKEKNQGKWVSWFFENHFYSLSYDIFDVFLEGCGFEMTASFAFSSNRIAENEVDQKNSYYSEYRGDPQGPFPGVHKFGSFGADYVTQSAEKRNAI